MIFDWIVIVFFILVVVGIVVLAIWDLIFPEDFPEYES